MVSFARLEEEGGFSGSGRGGKGRGEKRTDGAGEGGWVGADVFRRGRFGRTRKTTTSRFPENDSCAVFVIWME